jgi:hypothetical protein
MTSETTTPTNLEIKSAVVAQMAIMKAFAEFLDRTFPGKGVLKSFTDLQMHHPVPPSVYRDPWIGHFKPEAMV